MTSSDPVLLEMLTELSWRQGPVTLASGRVSDFYIDCKQTALNALGARRIGLLVWRRIQKMRREGIDVRGVGGLTLGADPIAIATALMSADDHDPVHAFIVRKEPKGHGTASWLEGQLNVPDGTSVLIVEDVITTGNSTLQAIERAQACGLRPVAVVSIVDREEGGAEAISEKTGLPVQALLRRSDFLPPS